MDEPGKDVGSDRNNGNLFHRNRRKYEGSSRVTNLINLNENETATVEDIRKIAQDLLRFISISSGKTTTTLAFLNDVRRQINVICKQCCSYMEANKNFPARDDIYRLLREYIELEYKNIDKENITLEEAEKKVLQILLYLGGSVHVKDKSITPPEFAMQVLCYNSTSYSANGLVMKMIMTLLVKMNRKEEVERLVSVPVHLIWNRLSFSPVSQNHFCIDVSSDECNSDSDIEEVKSCPPSPLRNGVNRTQLQEVNKNRLVPTIDILDDDDEEVPYPLYAANEVESVRLKREPESQFSFNTKVEGDYKHNINSNDKSTLSRALVNLKVSESVVEIDSSDSEEGLDTEHEDSILNKYSTDEGDSDGKSENCALQSVIPWEENRIDTLQKDTKKVDSTNALQVQSNGICGENNYKPSISRSKDDRENEKSSCSLSTSNNITSSIGKTNLVVVDKEKQQTFDNSFSIDNNNSKPKSCEIIETTIVIDSDDDDDIVEVVTPQETVDVKTLDILDNEHTTKEKRAPSKENRSQKEVNVPESLISTDHELMETNPQSNSDNKLENSVQNIEEQNTCSNILQPPKEASGCLINIILENEETQQNLNPAASAESHDETEKIVECFQHLALSNMDEATTAAGNDETQKLVECSQHLPLPNINEEPSKIIPSGKESSSVIVEISDSNRQDIFLGVDTMVDNTSSICCEISSKDTIDNCCYNTHIELDKPPVENQNLDSEDGCIAKSKNNVDDNKYTPKIIEESVSESTSTDTVTHVQKENQVMDISEKSITQNLGNIPSTLEDTSNDKVPINNDENVEEHAASKLLQENVSAAIELCEKNSIVNSIDTEQPLLENVADSSIITMEVDGKQSESQSNSTSSKKSDELIMGNSFKSLKVIDDEPSCTNVEVPIEVTEKSNSNCLLEENSSMDKIHSKERSRESNIDENYSLKKLTESNIDMIKIDAKEIENKSNSKTDLKPSKQINDNNLKSHEIDDESSRNSKPSCDIGSNLSPDNLIGKISPTPETDTENKTNSNIDRTKIKSKEHPSSSKIVQNSPELVSENNQKTLAIVADEIIDKSSRSAEALSDMVENISSNHLPVQIDLDRKAESNIDERKNDITSIEHLSICEIPPKSPKIVSENNEEAVDKVIDEINNKSSRSNETPSNVERTILSNNLVEKEDIPIETNTVATIELLTINNIESERKANSSKISKKPSISKIGSHLESNEKTFNKVEESICDKSSENNLLVPLEPVDPTIAEIPGENVQKVDKLIITNDLSACEHNNINKESIGVSFGSGLVVDQSKNLGESIDVALGTNLMLEQSDSHIERGSTKSKRKQKATNENLNRKLYDHETTNNLEEPLLLQPLSLTVEEPKTVLEEKTNLKPVELKIINSVDEPINMSIKTEPNTFIPKYGRKKNNKKGKIENRKVLGSVHQKRSIITCPSNKKSKSRRTSKNISKLKCDLSKPSDLDTNYLKPMDLSMTHDLNQNKDDLDLIKLKGDESKIIDPPTKTKDNLLETTSDADGINSQSVNFHNLQPEKIPAENTLMLVETNKINMKFENFRKAALDTAKILKHETPKEFGIEEKSAGSTIVDENTNGSEDFLIIDEGNTVNNLSLENKSLFNNVDIDAVSVGSDNCLVIDEDISENESLKQMGTKNNGVGLNSFCGLIERDVPPRGIAVDPNDSLKLLALTADKYGYLNVKKAESKRKRNAGKTKKMPKTKPARRITRSSSSKDIDNIEKIPNLESTVQFKDDEDIPILLKYEQTFINKYANQPKKAKSLKTKIKDNKQVPLSSITSSSQKPKRKYNTKKSKTANKINIADNKVSLSFMEDIELINKLSKEKELEKIGKALNDTRSNSIINDSPKNLETSAILETKTKVETSVPIVEVQSKKKVDDKRSSKSKKELRHQESTQKEVTEKGRKKSNSRQEKPTKNGKAAKETIADKVSAKTNKNFRPKEIKDTLEVTTKDVKETKAIKGIVNTVDVKMKSSVKNLDKRNDRKKDHQTKSKLSHKSSNNKSNLKPYLFNSKNKIKTTPSDVPLKEEHLLDQVKNDDTLQSPKPRELKILPTTRLEKENIIFTKDSVEVNSNLSKESKPVLLESKKTKPLRKGHPNLSETLKSLQVRLEKLHGQNNADGSELEREIKKLEQKEEPNETDKKKVGDLKPKTKSPRKNKNRGKTAAPLKLNQQPSTRKSSRLSTSIEINDENSKKVEETPKSKLNNQNKVVSNLPSMPVELSTIQRTNSDSSTPPKKRKFLSVEETPLKKRRYTIDDSEYIPIKEQNETKVLTPVENIAVLSTENKIVEEIAIVSHQSKETTSTGRKKTEEDIVPAKECGLDNNLKDTISCTINSDSELISSAEPTISDGKIKEIVTDNMEESTNNIELTSTIVPEEKLESKAANLKPEVNKVQLEKIESKLEKTEPKLKKTESKLKKTTLNLGSGSRAPEVFTSLPVKTNTQMIEEVATHVDLAETTLGGNFNTNTENNIPLLSETDASFENVTKNLDKEQIKPLETSESKKSNTESASDKKTEIFEEPASGCNFSSVKSSEKIDSISKTEAIVQTDNMKSSEKIDNTYSILETEVVVETVNVLEIKNVTDVAESQSEDFINKNNASGTEERIEIASLETDLIEDNLAVKQPDPEIAKENGLEVSNESIAESDATRIKNTSCDSKESIEVVSFGHKLGEEIEIELSDPQKLEETFVETTNLSVTQNSVASNNNNTYESEERFEIVSLQNKPSENIIESKQCDPNKEQNLVEISNILAENVATTTDKNSCVSEVEIKMVSLEPKFSEDDNLNTTSDIEAVEENFEVAIIDNASSEVSPNEDKFEAEVNVQKNYLDNSEICLSDDKLESDSNTENNHLSTSEGLLASEEKTETISAESELLEAQSPTPSVNEVLPEQAGESNNGEERIVVLTENIDVLQGNDDKKTLVNSKHTDGEIDCNYSKDTLVEKSTPHEKSIADETFDSIKLDKSVENIDKTFDEEQLICTNLTGNRNQEKVVEFTSDTFIHLENNLCGSNDTNEVFTSDSGAETTLDSEIIETTEKSSTNKDHADIDSDQNSNTYDAISEDNKVASWEVRCVLKENVETESAETSEKNILVHEQELAIEEKEPVRAIEVIEAPKVEESVITTHETDCSESAETIDCNFVEDISRADNADESVGKELEKQTESFEITFGNENDSIIEKTTSINKEKYIEDSESCPEAVGAAINDNQIETVSDSKENKNDKDIMQDFEEEINLNSEEVLEKSSIIPDIRPKALSNITQEESKEHSDNSEVSSDKIEESTEHGGEKSDVFSDKINQRLEKKSDIPSTLCLSSIEEKEIINSNHEPFEEIAEESKIEEFNVANMESQTSKKDDPLAVLVEIFQISEDNTEEEPKIKEISSDSESFQSVSKDLAVQENQSIKDVSFSDIQTSTPDQPKKKLKTTSGEPKVIVEKIEFYRLNNGLDQVYGSLDYEDGYGNYKQSLLHGSSGLDCKENDGSIQFEQNTFSENGNVKKQEIYSVKDAAVNVTLSDIRKQMNQVCVNNDVPMVDESGNVSEIDEVNKVQITLSTSSEDLKYSNNKPISEMVYCSIPCRSPILNGNDQEYTIETNDLTEGIQNNSNSISCSNNIVLENDGPVEVNDSSALPMQVYEQIIENIKSTAETNKTTQNYDGIPVNENKTPPKETFVLPVGNQSNPVVYNYNINSGMDHSYSDVGGPLLSEQSRKKDTFIKEARSSVENDLVNSPEGIFLSDENNFETLTPDVLQEAPCDFQFSGETFINFLISDFEYSEQNNLETEKKYSETSFISSDGNVLTSLPSTIFQPSNEDENVSSWFGSSKSDSMDLEENKLKLNSVELNSDNEKEISDAVSSAFPDIHLEKADGEESIQVENSNLDVTIPLPVQFIESTMNNKEKEEASSGSKFSLASLSDILDESKSDGLYVSEKMEQKKVLDEVLSLQPCNIIPHTSTPVRFGNTYSRKKPEIPKTPTNHSIEELLGTSDQQKSMNTPKSNLEKCLNNIEKRLTVEEGMASTSENTLDNAAQPERISSRRVSSSNQKPQEIVQTSTSNPKEGKRPITENDLYDCTSFAVNSLIQLISEDDKKLSTATPRTPQSTNVASTKNQTSSHRRNSDAVIKVAEPLNFEPDVKEAIKDEKKPSDRSSDDPDKPTPKPQSQTKVKQPYVSLSNRILLLSATSKPSDITKIMANDSNFYKRRNQRTPVSAPPRKTTDGDINSGQNSESNSPSSDSSTSPPQGEFLNRSGIRRGTEALPSSNKLKESMSENCKRILRDSVRSSLSVSGNSTPKTDRTELTHRNGNEHMERKSAGLSTPLITEFTCDNISDLDRKRKRREHESSSEFNSTKRKLTEDVKTPLILPKTSEHNENHKVLSQETKGHSTSLSKPTSNGCYKMSAQERSRSYEKSCPKSPYPEISSVKDKRTDSSPNTYKDDCSRSSNTCSLNKYDLIKLKSLEKQNKNIDVLKPQDTGPIQQYKSKRKKRVEDIYSKRPKIECVDSDSKVCEEKVIKVEEKKPQTSGDSKTNSSNDKSIDRQQKEYEEKVQAKVGSSSSTSTNSSTDKVFTRLRKEYEEEFQAKGGSNSTGAIPVKLDNSSDIKKVGVVKPTKRQAPSSANMTSSMQNADIHNHSSSTRSHSSSSHRESSREHLPSQSSSGRHSSSRSGHHRSRLRSSSKYDSGELIFLRAPWPPSSSNDAYLAAIDHMLPKTSVYFIPGLYKKK